MNEKERKKERKKQSQEWKKKNEAEDAVYQYLYPWQNRQLLHSNHMQYTITKLFKIVLSGSHMPTMMLFPLQKVLHGGSLYETFIEKVNNLIYTSSFSPDYYYYYFHFIPGKREILTIAEDSWLQDGSLYKHFMDKVKNFIYLLLLLWLLQQESPWRSG